MTKTIIFVSDFNLVGSGYLQVSVPLCKGLSELGYKVLAIGINYEGQEHNFPFTIIPCKTFQDAQAMLFNLHHMENPEVLIVALDLPHQGFFIERKPVDLKYICITPLENPPLTMSWAAPLLNADGVFFISQTATDAAHKAGVIDAEHIKIGIDSSWKMPTLEEKERIRKGLGVEDKFVVLTVADNQERKNLWAALEMIARAKKDGADNLKYILITREHLTFGWKLRDLCTELGINDEVMIIERGLSFDILWTYYAASDLFLLVSKAEGLCLPIMEAQACFVGDTIVEVDMDDVVGEVEREYSGDIIHIETDRAEFDVTPEHPFWTTDGWQYAEYLDVGYRLLYNPLKQYKGDANAKEGISSFYRGRIDHLVHTLQNSSCKDNCRDDGENNTANTVASTPIGISSSNTGKNYLSSNESFYGEAILHSRTDRWRGNNYNKENGREKKRKLEADGNNIKHIGIIGRLAQIASGLSFYLYRKSSSLEKSRSSLSASSIGAISSSILRDDDAKANNKEKTNGTDNRVFKFKVGTINKRPPYEIPSFYYLSGSGVEFETIRSISRKRVEKINVYNLKTKLGCYFVDGYLVHNCGVPVMATDTGAIPELLSDGRGFSIPVEYTFRDVWGNGKRDMVNIEAGAKMLRELMEMDLSETVTKAKMFTNSRTWDYPIQQLVSKIEEITDEPKIYE